MHGTCGLLVIMHHYTNTLCYNLMMCYMSLYGHYRQLYCEMGEQNNVLYSQCIWTGHMTTLLYYVNMSICLCIITIIITTIRSVSFIVLSIMP